MQGKLQPWKWMVDTYLFHCNYFIRRKDAAVILKGSIWTISPRSPICGLYYDMDEIQIVFFVVVCLFLIQSICIRSMGRYRERLYPLGWRRSIQCQELPEAEEGLARQAYKGWWTNNDCWACSWWMASHPRGALTAPKPGNGSIRRTKLAEIKTGTSSHL